MDGIHRHLLDAVLGVSVVVLIVTAIARGGGRGGRDDGSAIEIARRRLARGAVSPEQFQEIRWHLDSEMRPPQPS